MIFALLPVKAPAQAKARLSALFSPEERERLARVMFDEVLQALLAVRGLDRLLVVSSDADVLRRAAAAGASTLAETHQNGHSSSADWAVEKCIEWGATTLLLVPTDVPLLRPVEVESLLEAALAMPVPRLMIVPSADGMGTNALVRTPPDIIESRFGPGSFAAHLAQAREVQVAVAVTRPEGLVFDLDTPEDVGRFLARAPSGPTADLLRGMGAPQRLRAVASTRQAASSATSHELQDTGDKPQDGK